MQIQRLPQTLATITCAPICNIAAYSTVSTFFQVIILSVVSRADAHHEDEEIENAAAIEQWDAIGWEDTQATATISIAAVSTHQGRCWRYVVVVLPHRGTAALTAQVLQAQVHK